MHKKPKERMALPETAIKIIRLLLKKQEGESFPREIAKELGINLTSVVANIKKMENYKMGGIKLITSAWKKLPDNKIKVRDKAKFYKITNKKLALKLLKASNFLS